MKTIVLEGTVERAPCEQCGCFVDATYSYGPVELEPGLVVNDVMRGTCNRCGRVIATAPQSAHRFKAALEKKQHRRTTIRIPHELQDFISQNLSTAGADSGHAELYFRALLLACRGREIEIGRKLMEVEDAVLRRPRPETVNLNLTPNLAGVLSLLEQASQLKNTSELLRRLLVLADGELAHVTQEECVRLASAYA